MSDFPTDLDDGWIDAELAAEFPDLKLRTAAVPTVAAGPSEGVREQLRFVSDRMSGARAIKLRRDPIPSAYRVFYRHVGLDPDKTLTPVEQAALGRLFHGGYSGGDRVGDALLLALVETGVPIYAVDEETLAGPLGVRPARAGERLGTGEHDPDLRPGRLVVADPDQAVAALFGDVAPAFRVTKRCRTVRLLAVGVAGVPRIHVEEALFACAEALQAP